MKINHETRTLELGHKDCTSCQHGTVATRKDCATCKGTGNGPRGGKGKCRPCYGTGNRWDHEDRSTCPKCEGQYEAHDDEGICDTIGEEWIGMVRWEVLRVDRAIGFGQVQSLVGVAGSLYTVVDYGRSTDTSDEALVASAKDGARRTQAVKVVRGSDMRLCDGIAIVVVANGYTLLPVWDDEQKTVAA